MSYMKSFLGPGRSRLEQELNRIYPYSIYDFDVAELAANKARGREKKVIKVLAGEQRHNVPLDLMVKKAHGFFSGVINRNTSMLLPFADYESGTESDLSSPTTSIGSNLSFETTPPKATAKRRHTDIGLLESSTLPATPEFTHKKAKGPKPPSPKSPETSILDIFPGLSNPETPVSQKTISPRTAEEMRLKKDAQEYARQVKEMKIHKGDAPKQSSSKQSSSKQPSGIDADEYRLAEPQSIFEKAKKSSKKITPKKKKDQE